MRSEAEPETVRRKAAPHGAERPDLGRDKSMLTAGQLAEVSQEVPSLCMAGSPFREGMDRQSGSLWRRAWRIDFSSGRVTKQLAETWVCHCSATGTGSGSEITSGNPCGGPAAAIALRTDRVHDGVRGE